jgi:general secretion pathway protein C
MVIGNKFIDTKVNPLLTSLIKITIGSRVQAIYSPGVYWTQRGVVSLLALIKALIALSLVIWIALSLSSIFWRLLPELALTNVAIPVNVAAFAPASTQASANIDIEQLKSLALFGKESADVPIVVAEPVEIIEQVEKTRLNLKLVGSYAHNNKDLGYAIIAKGSDQDLYKVGDEIAGFSNVLLIGVYSEKIILANKGKREALYMFPEGESYASAAVSPSSPATSIQPPSEDIRSIDIEADLDSQTISDVIRFSRTAKDGKMLGFRVLPGRNRQVFDQTGLQLNDVVVAIDGQALDDLRAANSIYQEKRDATQASLLVLRGEEKLMINIDLNNINLN